MLHPVVLPVLAWFVEHGQLATQLAALMSAIDDHALDHAYGPNLAATIDARVGLPGVTAATVLGELAILRPRIQELPPILRRIAGRRATADGLRVFRG
ncbi:hypothetical protein [Micromonospora chersina]|uniref:hypothetical protein n=1 Tax=Micromonospora chersina TaxID=47854 RepID=UPI00142F307F|nr:hypothetical protein [Micromonospora chersina]